MRNKPMCPMMMNQMPMQMHKPMCMQMPMMEQFTMPAEMQEMPYDDDDKDEEYFKSMYSDTCHEMMPYVMGTVDRMEQKGDMLYEDYPKREMIDRMTDEAYNDLTRDMPDMADEMSEERIIIRPRRFARDLVRILLINELLGRRRRRRRHHHDNYGSDYDDDYYFQD